MIVAGDGRQFVVSFSYPNKHTKHNDTVNCVIKEMITVNGVNYISTQRFFGVAKYNLSNEPRPFDKGYGRRMSMTRAIEAAQEKGLLKDFNEGYFWAEYKERHSDKELEVAPEDLHH